MIFNKLFKRPTLNFLFIFLAITGFYLLWLGSYPLFIPDEGRYSEIAREMFVNHNFITPYLNGIIFLDKPILYYWLQILAMSFFGLNEWAVRFFPAMVGIATCMMTYLTAYFLFNQRTAILAAIILSTSPLFYASSHYANLDLEVAGFVSMSLFCFLMATKESPYRFVLLMAAYTFSSLAALTKGLIGIVFPILIVSMWVVITRRFDFLKNMRLILGITLFAAIVFPWYLLAQLATPEFFHYFFVTQQASRFLSAGSFNNKTVIWFYLPVILVGFYPWCFFILQVLGRYSLAVIRHIKNLNNEYGYHLYLLLWVGIITVFFSIPSSKTLGYILPVFPALSLLTAIFLNEEWEKKKVGFPTQLIMLTFVSVCVAIFFFSIYLPYFSHIEISQDIIPLIKNYGRFFIFITLFLLIMQFNLKFIPKFNIKFIYSLFLVIAISVCFSLIHYASILNHKTIKPLAIQLKQHLHPNDEIVTFYKYYQDLPFYINKTVSVVADWNADDIIFNDNWIREMWYGMHWQKSHEWLLSENEFWQKWHGNKQIYVFMHKDVVPGFKKMAKSKFYILGESNDITLISNNNPS